MAPSCTFLNFKIVDPRSSTPALTNWVGNNHTAVKSTHAEISLLTLPCMNHSHAVCILIVFCSPPIAQYLRVNNPHIHRHNNYDKYDQVATVHVKASWN